MNHSILYFLLVSLVAIPLQAEKRDLNKAIKEIDLMVNAGLKKQKLKANPTITDEVFLRRIYLDLCGRIPTPEEADRFNHDKSSIKRSKLIDKLLKTEAYNSDQLNFWSDILRIYRDRGHTMDSAAYHLWIRKAIKENMPYDKMVYNLVSAQGKIWDNGASAYYVRDRGMPLDNMSNTVRIFLGVRMECAQCHDHPFDDWTQKDYYKMAAFSYGVTTPTIGSEKTSNKNMINRHISVKQKEAYLKAVGDNKFPYIANKKYMDKYIKKYSKKYLAKNKMTQAQFRKKVASGIAAAEKVKTNAYAQRQAMNQLYQPLKYTQSMEDEKRQLKLPHDYQYDDAKPLDVIKPSTMFGNKIDLTKTKKTKLEAYAAWMTSKKNPNFAKAIANRMWAKAFGTGVLNPVDDMAGYAKSSNPKLLAYLEQLMKDLNFNLRDYQRVLYKTVAYQREANHKEFNGELYYFPGPLLRRMSAEQIWDSLVSLSIKNADDYHPGIAKQQEQVKKAYQMYKGLEEKPFEEYQQMITRLGSINAKVFIEQNRLSDLLNKARIDKNKKEYDKYRSELGSLRKELRNDMYKAAYGDLNGELTNAPAMMMSMGSMTGGSSSKIVTTLPKPEKMKPPRDLDKRKKKSWIQKEKYEYRNYFKLISQMARASEIEQPARRGHFLRDFGQSDREVIQNSSDSASIPQALNLLNGQIIDALANRYSLLGKRLFLAKTPEEKINGIFQAMLTRKATSEEMSMMLEDIKIYGERSYRGLIWSLLNTQQFLFIQ
jgi:hypothetical protein